MSARLDAWSGLAFGFIVFGGFSTGWESWDFKNASL